MFFLLLKPKIKKSVPIHQFGVNLINSFWAVAQGSYVRLPRYKRERYVYIS